MKVDEQDENRRGSFNEAVQKKINTSRTGDSDLRFYITTVQDG